MSDLDRFLTSKGVATSGGMSPNDLSFTRKRAEPVVPPDDVPRRDADIMAVHSTVNPYAYGR